MSPVLGVVAVPASSPSSSPTLGLLQAAPLHYFNVLWQRQHLRRSSRASSRLSCCFAMAPAR